MQLVQLMEEVKRGSKPNFVLSDDGILRFGTRLCVPKDGDLRRELLEEAHCSKFAIHPRGTKMYRDLKQNYWWPDGQSERVIQVLEDLLRACALDLKGNWDDYLPIVEFAYNNSFQASIGMTPFKALYVDCFENVSLIKERLKAAQNRQKSYVDNHRRDLEFEVGDHVFLKVSPMKSIMRFEENGKLSPRCVGPFEVLEKVGTLPYKVALPPSPSKIHNAFHVSTLRKYIYDSSHVVELESIQNSKDLIYEEVPIQIVDVMDKVLCHAVVKLVKIQWSNHSIREAT
ncbi:Transposon Tf2-11 polyprotein [Vitis vinifera]|uniref:Transposon Tf2-11 polyprotein n=1 Tax=Vitis vinifera TaxID=29760 RepID=A0A438H8S4_VITVI|nr:Transposon Tf2-11 polyprotein [Vitis vinifera]